MEPIIQIKPEDIKYLILHHSATSRDFTSFLAVKNYHINQRGFWDIGYHFFITGDGKLHRGRPEDYVGAHCRTLPPSMNFRSLGICLAGNFEREEPNKAQLITLKFLLRFLMEKYSIPAENVLGHNQVLGTSTLCPGINFLCWIDEWRSKKNDPRLKKIAIKLREIAKKIAELMAKIRNLRLIFFL